MLDLVGASRDSEVAQTPLTEKLAPTGVQFRSAGVGSKTSHASQTALVVGYDARLVRRARLGAERVLLQLAPKGSDR